MKKIVLAALLIAAVLSLTANAIAAKVESVNVAGKVASVMASQIVVTKDGNLPEGKKKIKHDPENGVHVYELRKFMRSNASTCINQKVIVRKGQHVKKGEVIATLKVGDIVKIESKTGSNVADSVKVIPPKKK